MKKLLICILILSAILFNPASAVEQTSAAPRYEAMIKSIKVPSSSFVYYVINGEKDTVQQLLDEGADPNFTYAKIPATFFASYYRQYEILELLLDKGADVNKKCLGITLLDFSVYNLDAKSADIAIKKQAYFDKKTDGVIYLRYAVKKNNDDLIKILLNEDIKPDRYCIKYAKKLKNENTQNLIMQKAEL